MIYLVLGRRQLGKTTLAYSMARKCPRRLIFDPRGQIHSDGLRVSDRALLAGAMDDMADPKDPIKEILVTPDQDVQGMFDACAREVKAWADDFAHAPRSARRLMFLIDEARLVKLLDSAAFEYVMRAAPPDLIQVAITAHRPADIPTDVRAISDHWLLFRCTQEHDLKVIRERCTESVCNQVAQLAPHQFIHWDDATAKAFAHREPGAWFVPLRSSAAPDGPGTPMLPETAELPANAQLDTARLFER